VDAEKGDQHTPNWYANTVIVGVEDCDIDVGGEIAALVVLSEVHVPVGKLRAFIG
jgi:hypothetical protein